MAIPVRKLVTAAFLSGLLLVSPSVSAQESSESTPRKDPRQAFLETLVTQYRAELRAFRQAQGKKDMTKHPGHRWAEVFWQYRAAHPDSPVAAQAARETVFAYLGAGAVDAAYARVAALAPDDSAWPRVLPMLSYFGAEHRDRFIEFAEKLVSQTQRERTKVVAYFTLAEAYRQKDPEKAKSHLRAAIEAAKAAPDAGYWKDAEGLLYELSYLNVGQTFPSFTVPALDESTFRPEDYRGKVVLLNFWATW